MAQHRHLHRKRPAAVACIVGALALVGVALNASTAAAAPVCDHTTSDVVVRLDDDDIGIPTTIGVQNNQLFVNGAGCGTATTVTTVTVVEIPTTERADDIIIDLTQPMRIDGAPVLVNLVLDPDAATSAPDRVRIIGSPLRDQVRLSPERVAITAATPFVSPTDDVRLVLLFHDSEIDLEFLLGGDNDTFDTVPEGGVHFDNRLTVRGGPGNDVIVGGPGDDVLVGDEGDDQIRGGNGDDTLVGKEGQDLIWGGGGDDTIRGGSDDDTLRGGRGVDIVRGQLGHDNIFGNSGRDTLRGGRDDDEVRGGSGGDTIRGDSGADVLFGNSGRDTIRGGSGADYVNGGKGRDMLFGNSGRDTFETDDGEIDTVNGGAGTKDRCNSCDDDDIIRRSVENP